MNNSIIIHGLEDLNEKFQILEKKICPQYIFLKYKVALNSLLPVLELGNFKFYLTFDEFA